MVILHGSGGEWSGRGVDQAGFLVQHGIGAFIVDTFVSRGLKKKDKWWYPFSFRPPKLFKTFPGNITTGPEIHKSEDSNLL